MRTADRAAMTPTAVRTLAPPTPLAREDSARLRLRSNGTWEVACGNVTLRRLTEDDIPAAAAACADRRAREMVRHRFAVDGCAAARQAVLTKELLGPWAYNIIPFAVWAVTQRRHQPRVVGVRYLETGTDREPTCGGWIGERWRQRGYGNDALWAAVALVYATNMGNQIRTATRQDNAAAQANLARAGFVATGLSALRQDPRGLRLGVWVHSAGYGSPVPAWKLST